MYELTVCYAIYNMYVYYLQNVWKCKKSWPNSGYIQITKIMNIA